MKTLMLVAVLLAASTGAARAGGSEGAIGLGAEFALSSFNPGGIGGGTFGIGGPSINYDAGAFHVGGFLSILDPDGADNTTFSFGGRFYYHVHSTGMSDFGLGGTLAVLNYDAGPDRNTNLYLEPGFQIRMFLAANVALSFTAGLAIGAIDDSGFGFFGQATGSAGFHYYFF